MAFSQAAGKIVFTEEIDFSLRFEMTKKALRHHLLASRSYFHYLKAKLNHKRIFKSHRYLSNSPVKITASARGEIGEKFIMKGKIEP